MVRMQHWGKIKWSSITLGLVEAFATLGYVFIIGQLIQAAIDQKYVLLIIYSCAGIGLFIVQQIAQFTLELLLAQWMPAYQAQARRWLFANWFAIVPKRQMTLGKINNAVFTDLPQIVTTEQNSLYRLAYAGGVLAASLAILAWAHWILALVIIGATILSFTLAWPFGKAMNHEQTKMSQNYEDFFTSAKAIHTNKAQYHYVRRLRDFCDAVLDQFAILKNKHARVSLRLSLAAQALSALSFAMFLAPIITAALLYGSQNITAGAIAMIVLLSDRVTSTGDNLASAIGALFRIRTLKAKYAPRSVSLITSLAFQDYDPVLPGASLVPRHLNLTIAPGRKYLFKGTNGVGKSTMLNPLDQPLDFTGALVVNGVAVTPATLEAYALARPTKTSALFDTESAIRAAFDVTDNALYQALWAAIRPFTLLATGSAGANSQGETQLLSLLHAVATRPHVLILDETLVSVAAPLRHALYAVLLAQTAVSLIVVDHTAPPQIERGFDEVITFHKKALSYSAATS